MISETAQYRAACQCICNALARATPPPSPQIFQKEREEDQLKKKEEIQAQRKNKRMSVLLVQEAAFTVIEQKRLEIEVSPTHHPSSSR